MLEFHEYANMFPLMDDADLAELADDIRVRGLRHPILMAEGKIADGRNRYRACIIAGVEPRFTQWDGKGSLIDAIMSDNLKRRHLTTSQRAMAATRAKPLYEAEAAIRRRATQNNETAKAVSANLREQDAGKASEKAAAALNVSPRSVESASSVLSHGVPELVRAVDRGDMAVSAAAQIAKLPPAQQIEAIAKPHVTHNSGVNEWYTPQRYIDAARQVLGTIDLDPASCAAANKIVNATQFYSAETDGLAQEWRGCVYMNPPYCSELIGKFSKKLAESYASGAVTSAITLTNNATETAWFADLIGRASAVCFPSERIKFLSPVDGKVGAPLQGQAFIYLGSNPGLFRDVFGRFGWTALL